MDLRVELGRRSSLLGGPPRASRTLRLERPFLADLPALLRAFPGPVRRLDATWPAIDGRRRAGARPRPPGRRGGGRRPRADRAARPERPRLRRGPPARPVHPRRRRGPHRAHRGRPPRPRRPRGRGGRRPRRPRRGDGPRDRRDGRRPVARRRAGGGAGRRPWRRGAGRRGDRGQPARRIRRRPAQDARPDGDQHGRVLHRRRAVRVDRAGGRRPRPLLPGGAGVAGPDRARRARRAAAPAAGRVAGDRVRDAVRTSSRTPASPGSGPTARPTATRRRSCPRSSSPPGSRTSPERANGATDRPARHGRRATCSGSAGRVARRPIPLGEVESARSIARRFVVSAMSVGALSPEAHQALTIGIQRAGGAANTGEGGEDPGWYVPGPDGERHDARIKQVASARFGVTATYLARGRAARDQDRPGLEARRGRPAPREEGHRLDRVAPPRPARDELHQPAAAPRHLLDRGPRPADRRPAGDQPGAPGSASSSSRAAASGRSPPASPRPARRTSTCRATRAARARRRCRASSTSARRGSSVSPRSTRRCSGTACATASPSARTAACGPAATC